MTAAARLDALIARYGNMLTSARIDHDMTRALYWKRIRWAETAICEYWGWDDDRESVRVAYDSRIEAAGRHAGIIHMLWQERRMLRLSAACVTRTEAMLARMEAPDALFADPATLRAMERL